MNSRHQHNVQQTMRGDIVVLLAMCMFAFVVLTTFVLIKFSPNTDFKIGRFFSVSSNQKTASATLGDVKLGTTLETLQSRHADAITGVNANGVITLLFAHGNSRYMVWYAKEGPYRIAYKVRQSLEVIGISENKYLEKITHRYGAPSLSSCSERLIDGMRDCQFSWWLPGKIRLDINSRQDIHAATRKLNITTQITDTQLSGRLQRTIKSVRVPKS